MVKTFLFLCLLSTLFYLSKTKSQQSDYYWRDYNGVIPEDAFSIGKDSDGNNVYIGQVYVDHHGVFVGAIYPGKMEMEFSCYGIKTADKYIRILCTRHPERFIWLSTTAATLHLNTIDKHVVVGGFNSKEDGVYNIGRAMYGGSTQVGPINSFFIENADFFFVYKNKHFTDIKYYEVLVYVP